MNREDEIEYARRNNIPIPVTIDSPYSTDQNLWGRSIEAGATPLGSSPSCPLND